MRVTRAIAVMILLGMLTGCTVMNTAVKQDWYRTDAKYTWVSWDNNVVKSIKTGKDLWHYPYNGKGTWSLAYNHTLSGNDGVVYYANPGNYRGFNFYGGPDRAGLQKSMAILKDFVTWSELSKAERVASQGNKLKYSEPMYNDRETFFFEHPDGPVMLVRVSAENKVLCLFQNDCWAAFITPDTARIMIEEMSFIGRTKFTR